MALGGADRELVVRVVGDASNLDKTFRKASASTTRFGKDISRTGRGAIAGTGAFQSLGRSVAFASAGFLGGLGLAAGVRAAFDEMSEMQKVAAQTNAAIKSTGGVAGVTARHVEELGKTLLNLSGIDDELIKNSENLLLTFKNIRNVGAGQDAVFDRTAKSALDLSIRFGKDLPSATILLAKALNDPVRGLTALQRAGVQFDTAQRKVIKRLVESGHLFEAQKLILREVESQTGGAAKAFGNTLAGKLGLLRETLRNVAGVIATLLLPSITKIVDRLTAWVKNTDNQKAAIDKVTGAVRTFAHTIGTIGDISGKIAGFVGGWKNAITILIGLWAGFKLAGILAAQQVMFANIVAAEGTAAAWKAALISTGFGAIVVAAGVAASLIIAHWDKVKIYFRVFWTALERGALRTFLRIVEPFSHLPHHAGQWARDLKDQVRSQIDGLDKTLDELAVKMQGVADVKAPAGIRGPITAEDVQKRADRFAARPTAGTAPGDEAKQAKEAAKRVRQAREAFRQEMQDRAQLAVDRTALTKSVADDIAALGRLNALLKRRIAGGHDTIAVEREQLQVQLQINDLLKQQAEQRKAARDARQFKILGFGPTGEDIIPGVKGLKRQLASVTDAIEGTFLDTGKTRKKLASIRQVLKAGVGHISDDVRSKIQQMIADLKAQLKKGSVDVTRFNKTARGQFVAAGAHPGGTGTVVVQGGIHLHGIRDMKDLENALAKRHKQRGHHRRSTR